MRTEKPAVIALAAGLPVALFVLWWVYRRQRRASEAHDANTRNENQAEQLATSEDKILSHSVHSNDGDLRHPEQTQNDTQPIGDDFSAAVRTGRSIQSKEDITDADRNEVTTDEQTGHESCYSSVQSNNNNEEALNQDVMTKIVMVVDEPDNEGDAISKMAAENQQAAKGIHSLHGENATSEFADSALPDETLGSEEAITEEITPSTINLAGTAANIATETVTSISAYETKEDIVEQSSIPCSELSRITESDFTANDTTNLLDNAITDSVQFNMSLPGSQSDAEDSQSSDDIESVRPGTAEATEMQVVSGDAPTAETSNLTENGTSENDTRPFSTEDTTQEERLHELGSYSQGSSSSESSGADTGDVEEGSGDFLEPKASVPVKSANEENVSLVLESEQTDADTVQDENGPNENNNNNSNNDKSCRNTQGDASESVKTTAAIISNSDTESGETEDGADSRMMNGKLDLRTNKNGLVAHTHPMHNGSMPQSVDENGSVTENISDETQIYLEFPSEKVGLLIGKNGRNIKTLKQESGAEVIVHTVPFRDDIQVLQVVGFDLTGTPSSVQSAASKIQKRFKYIALKEFDAASAMGLISPSSVISSPGVMSPMESPLTPPTFAYPVPDMSQLRLPDGIMVEVVVSSISDCDCVFLQQYTHPTYPALASLEHAMSVCYSSPSTPSLLTPVQVGLVCVAQHGDMWYRAQVIHSNEEANEVTIKFVDYGGYSTVPTTTVKQIRADFITLPFQATECYLDNICPPEDKNTYSIGSTTVLQEILKEGEFHARISRYRGDGHPLILLYRRLETKTELVNNLLVKEGVAKWFEYGGESSAAMSLREDQ